MAVNMCSVVMQMAFPTKLTNHLHSSRFNPSPKLHSTRSRLRLCSSASASASASSEISTIGRRSGNYSPSRWDADFIHSLVVDPKEQEKNLRRGSELIAQVKMEMEKETDPTRQLEFIDDLQKMGLSDHFRNEFKEILNSIYLDHKYYKNTPNSMEEMNLYSTSLAFRLLREHGFQVSQV